MARQRGKRPTGACLAAGAIAAALAGCAPTLIAERYTANVSPRIVVLGCRDVYEVYDKPDSERVLVTSSVGTEATAGLCASEQSRPQRFRAVAERFFLDAGKPGMCRIGDVTELSPLHWEIGYRCG